MKKSYKSFLVLLCLTSALLTVGIITSIAQTTSNNVWKNKPAAKLLWELVRAKRQDSPFVLLTPKDLAKISTAEKETLSGAGDVCETATQITIGQTIGGALNNTDCQLNDNSYADFYVFNGNQGQQVTILLRSSGIDSYLGLANETGTFVVEDDDSGGGLDSRITVTLPETGLYVILANSALPNEFGGYTLYLSGAQPCTYSVSPTSTEIPATGGTFSFTVNTQPECHWKAVSLNSFTTTNSAGIGPGTVTYTVSQNGSGQTRSGSVIVSSAPHMTLNAYFSISQSSVSCSYSLAPSSVNIPATQTTGTFQIIAPAGCPWSARSYSDFVTADGSGTGTATITYNARHNNGEARVAIIKVGELTFTINQAGLNCTYTLSPRQINVSRRGTAGTIAVDTQPNCTWSATRNVLWVDLQTTFGTGAGTISYTVAPYTEPGSRWGAIQFSYTYTSSSGGMSVTFDQNGTFNNPDFDYTGDGKADLAVFRPSTGAWHIRQTDSVVSTYRYGLATDKIVPGDYDGNGKMDIAVFRPSNGTWYFDIPSRGRTAFQFGTDGDIPVPADYDNDGADDIAVYRPSNGVWYIVKSSDGQLIIRQFGIAEDIPTLGDFDGDGKADIAVWRPSTGGWYRLNSSDDSFFAVAFGISEDKPTPADFDGDGKTDIAVWRPSDRNWYRLNSSDNSFSAVQFGLSDDMPVVADYDGDKKADIAVFRPSNGDWYLLNSTTGFTIGHFGLPGDMPIPNAFVR